MFEEQTLRSRKFTLLIAALVLVPLSACSRKEVTEKRFYPMGGIPFMVKAYNIPSQLFDEAFADIQADTERLENLLSSHREGSELARLNRTGEGKVSTETARLLKLSAHISAETDGAFDVTVGPLLELWRYCAAQDRMPTEQELKQALEMVDWKQVAVSSHGNVSFRKTNMSVDLGGIAKGFVADVAAQKMKKQGIRRGIIDVGGDLVLFNSVGEEPFRIGVKNPDTPESKFAILQVDSGAVVTSGCYERYYEIQNEQVCHVVDPRTGRPVSELASVTILAEEAAVADALATGTMVLGKERGQALIKSLPGVEGILIWKGKKGLEWWISSGLHGKVSIVE